MINLSYCVDGLILKRNGTAATDRQIRDLQRDLRCLGYLRSGIDGKFGEGTELSVKALQHDLRNNNGDSKQGDGKAPISIMAYNKGRVTDISGIVDQGTAQCISDMINDPKFPKLPKTDNPRAENTRVVDIVRMKSQPVPIPFLLAILKRESDLKHYHEPAANDEDTYITVGLDKNVEGSNFIITSRGYGVGQYTLFHHPPRKEEITDFMEKVEGNINKAVRELREKFDKFVNGNSGAMRADDRIKEIGTGQLRICKYPQTDQRYMKECRNCMVNAGLKDIPAGTQVFDGATLVFEPTQYYGNSFYKSVPVRKNIGCDWPYAARRYNGSGINSYHYQVLILQNVLNG